MIFFLATVLFAFNFYDVPKVHLDPISIPDIKINPPPMDCLSNAEQNERNIFYCPVASSLVLNGTTWSAPGNWKSYQVSFTSQVTRFLGAQWTGNNVGRTVCLYAGNNPNDFPVQLVFPSLSLLPDLPVWDISKNSANCVSDDNQVCDCPINLFSEQPAVDTAKAAVMQLDGY